MYLNIMHRTAIGPKYSIFREQQRTIHELGIKGTVFVHYRDLFEDQTIRDVLSDAEQFGDEIGLALHDMGGPGLDELVGNLPAIWLFDRVHKREILDRILSKFREVFGRLPSAVASYHFDSSALAVLRDLAPEVETVVGGCFEEGVRVFHGCNHSWYLFNEGMPWNPWYPSRGHSLRPAVDEEDWSGIVAVPHLVRDMSLSYEGRNDFWASHPPNVVRGMGNEASFNPYDLNLIDQYRLQEDFNDGYSYLNSFVGVNWLTWNHNSEYPPEVCWQLYRTFLNYLAELRDQGSVKDMTLSEYGRWHRKHRKFAEPEVYWAKEMLYDSGKHYFWYIDGQQRVLVDPTQGGSIGDIRPYAGRCEVATGPDTSHREIGSYPYLVQSQHRSGYAHHHEDGARTTLFLKHGEECVDLASCRTKVASVVRNAGKTELSLTPASIRFASGLVFELITRYRWEAQGGVIWIRRELRNFNQTNVELELIEHLKAAPGRTEYAEDLSDMELEAVNKERFAFDYASVERVYEGVQEVAANIPQTHSRLSLKVSQGEVDSAALKCGHLFSPYATLQLRYRLEGEGFIESSLSIEELNQA